MKMEVCSLINILQNNRKILIVNDKFADMWRNFFIRNS